MDRYSVFGTIIGTILGYTSSVYLWYIGIII